jgi:hypothetical protein
MADPDALTDLEFQLHRDAHAQLVLQRGDEPPVPGVVPVRAFPLSAADGPVALIGPDGRECAWIEQPRALPAQARELLEAELAKRSFAPVIHRLLAVSTFSTPSTWTVETDRGQTQLVLKGEEDIRRLDGQRLLVTDSHGIGYRITDARALDRRSRKLLERFL